MSRSRNSKRTAYTIGYFVSVIYHMILQFIRNLQIYKSFLLDLQLNLIQESKSSSLLE